MGLFIGNIKNGETVGFTLDNSKLEKDRAEKGKIWGVIFDPSGKKAFGKRLYNAKNLRFSPSYGIGDADFTLVRGVNNVVETVEKVTGSFTDTKTYQTCTKIGQLGIDDFFVDSGSDENSICPFKIEPIQCSKNNDGYYWHTVENTNPTIKDDGLGGSHYQLYMRFPKFYYCRPQKWEFLVSDKYLPGFLPSPMHYRDGHMYDYAYVSKYPLNIITTKPSDDYISMLQSSIFTKTTVITVENVIDANGQYYKNGYTSDTNLNVAKSNFSTIYNEKYAKAYHANRTRWPLDYSSLCMIYFLMYIKYNTMCPFIYVPKTLPNVKNYNREETTTFKCSTAYKTANNLSATTISNTYYTPMRELNSNINIDPVVSNMDKLDHTGATTTTVADVAMTPTLKVRAAYLESEANHDHPDIANYNISSNDHISNLDGFVWADSNCSKVLFETLGLVGFYGQRLFISGVFADQKGLHIYDLERYYKNNLSNSDPVNSSPYPPNVNNQVDAWNKYDIDIDLDLNKLPGNIDNETAIPTIVKGIGYSKRFPWAIFPYADDNVESYQYYCNRTNVNSVATNLEKQFAYKTTLSHPTTTFNYLIMQACLPNLTTPYMRKVSSIDTTDKILTGAQIALYSVADDNGSDTTFANI